MKHIRLKNWDKNTILYRIIPQLLFILTALWILWLTFYPDSHSFLVDVQTEKIAVTIKERSISLPVECDFTILVDGQTLDLGACETDAGKGNEIIGSLEVSIGSVITATRFGNGNLTLFLETPDQTFAPDPRTSVFANKIDSTNTAMRISYTRKTDDDYEDKHVVTRKVQLTIARPAERFAQGKPFLVSLKGTVSDIHEIDYQAEEVLPMIRSGALYLINKTIIFNDFYEIGPFSVHAGDGITFDELKDENMNVIFTINDAEPGLQLIVNGALAGEIGIKRFRHAPLYVRASALQKLLHDKMLPLFFSILAFSFPFVFRMNR